jgi:hypothetical protein
MSKRKEPVVSRGEEMKEAFLRGQKALRESIQKKDAERIAEEERKEQVERAAEELREHIASREAERAREVEAARFHRQVERAAITAFGELLRQLGEEHDLQFIEPDVMEKLGKRAWDWGLVFAEARKPND